MSPRRLRSAAGLLALAACACATAPQASMSTPNIVLFLVDDLGWQDISLPLGPERTAQNARFRTPNVERLAREGLAFTQAYSAAPVCTPTRAAILSGQTPARSRITYWTLHKDSDTSAPFLGLLPPQWNMNGLQPEDTTLPELLAQGGYHTIHVGKAHFGAVGTAGSDPCALGFDVNVAGHGAGAPGSFLGTENFSGAARKGDPVWDVPGMERWHGKDIYLDEALAIEAVEHVGRALDAGERFFLNFAPYSVHTPIQANARYVEHYAGLDPREAAYATMVETMDAALGAVLDELERRGVADETLVIFTSDNGGLSAHARGGTPHTHNAPLRSGKGSAYEGGTRVPLVIRWPGVVRPGASDAQVISTDLFPTMLSAAGLAQPSDGVVRDGVDLTPLLRGEASAPRRALVWHQPHYWGTPGPGIWPYSAVRLGDWKLIYRHADRGFELYDLAHDLGEEHDLAASEPERVRQLASVLGSELRRTRAQMSLGAASGLRVPWPDDVAWQR
jgi:arylsulfatase A-like enzyme